MSEYQRVSIVRRYRPSQQTINRAEGLASAALMAHASPAVAGLTGLGYGAFGEDADTFGDTLRDIIQDEPQTRVLSFKWQIISELRTLLAGRDADIECVSEAVLGIIPTVAPEEPPNWRSFSNLRAFWPTVLHAFENDPDV